MKTIQKKGVVGRIGQGIVEYTILVAVVITALIIFLGRGGVFEKSYNEVISTQGEDITDMSGRIFN